MGVANLFNLNFMSNADDHRWDLIKSDKGHLPESAEAFNRKFEEWQARNWSDWLAMNLTFPFTVARKEDEGDAYFVPGAAEATFRLGHKMEVFALEKAAVAWRVMIRVRENGQVGCVPLDDVEVTPKTDANFWPVREYVVWFANRC